MDASLAAFIEAVDRAYADGDVDLSDFAVLQACFTASTWASSVAMPLTASTRVTTPSSRLSSST